MQVKAMLLAVEERAFRGRHQSTAHLPSHYSRSNALSAALQVPLQFKLP